MVGVNVGDHVLPGVCEVGDGVVDHVLPVVCVVVLVLLTMFFHVSVWLVFVFLTMFSMCLWDGVSVVDNVLPCRDCVVGVGVVDHVIPGVCVMREELGFQSKLEEGTQDIINNIIWYLCGGC